MLIILLLTLARVIAGAGMLWFSFIAIFTNHMNFVMKRKVAIRWAVGFTLLFIFLAAI